MLNLLNELKDQEIISRTDYFFAKLMVEKTADESSELQQNLTALLAALCSWNYAQGNTCVYLEDGIQRYLFGLSRNQIGSDYLTAIAHKINFLLPSQWQQPLLNHSAFSTTPRQKVAPFVFQFNAVYFYRAWQDEWNIANYLKNALKNDRTLLWTTSLIKQKLDWVFPSTGSSRNGVDWQKIAVATALKNQFTLITGGPGTGKTTTVTKLLLVLQSLYEGRLRIKLVAPTGKAAARLTESVTASLKNLPEKYAIPISVELENALPKSAETIHRLLGIHLFDDGTKYHVHNPLPLDVLVVDETSMIDLPLMAKLIAALKPETRLILLGDKAQLSSVEAGAILGELGQYVTESYSPQQAAYLQETTGFALPHTSDRHPIRDNLCHLVESHRFKADSGIKALSEAVLQGDGYASWQLFTHFNDIKFRDLSTDEDVVDWPQYCVQLVVQYAVTQYRRYLEKLQACRRLQIHPGVITEEGSGRTYADEIFDLFNSVRMLTALRGSLFGVENLNEEIAQAFRRQKLVNFKHTRDWYLGRAIMVTENDHNVKLYNGDIGLCLTPNQVWFGNRAVQLSRIPAHESAFAMTIHKSQGSEFDHTILVLPPEWRPVLSRELIFTGVTRAKKHLTVFATPKIWQSAVENQVKRQSGLSRLLEN